MKRILVSWSSGKDCAWALHLLRQQSGIKIVAMLTTINSEFDRVAMHGTRSAVLEAQASAAALPLWKIPLPWPCSNEEYECRMAEVCLRATSEGIEAIAFGDLFLRDVRTYREKQLQSTGIEPLFPLWDIPTQELALDMISSGLRAKLVCVDSRQLDPSFAGRDFDAALLRDLPASIDPCGERGEFHSCVYDGPMFSHPLALDAGETVDRDGFIYADFKLAKTLDHDRQPAPDIPVRQSKTPSPEPSVRTFSL
ncbi:MAG: ATP-binding protein [Terracidiphilus sp.]